MTLALEVLRAGNGDCLLVHHGEDLFLVDGGAAGVYDATLGPRLEELARRRGGPLRFRLILVGHGDGDHLAGLADMFAEARRRESALWAADELWFNSFDALSGSRSVDALQALLAAASPDLGRAMAVSLATGTALREAADALGIDVNRRSRSGLVIRRDDTAPVVDLAPGVTFTVLGPSPDDVHALRDAWAAWELRDGRQAEPRLADDVVGSFFATASIAVLARTEQHSILLPGEAGHWDVLDGLRRAGLLNEPLTVDILQVPAQGAVTNLSRDFFEHVRARHYVISTSGDHGTPDTQTLATICEVAEPCTLWLTYGGEPGDGSPDLYERLHGFLADQPHVDIRFAAPGRSLLISLE